ncbi:CPBP family intramembrane metalloprotease [bacterium]|nr:CPBP family intramembrane metalloprotease [bacterium]MBU1883348.1 CPBP family intramembrane metalloprotease [bacterium]
MKTLILVLETFLLFFLPPLSIVAGFVPKAAVMPLLWMATLYAYIILRRSKSFELLFHFDKKEMGVILKRAVFIAPAIGVFTWLFYPELLFTFIKQHFLFWLFIMLLYPILSALLQEVLFRAFFEYRFASVIRNRQLFLLVNAIIFAYIHTVFGNAIAVTFSFLGSLLFMTTYQQSRSVLMSTIEHGLYGNLIFTLGIGQFFYHGA